MKPAVHLSFVLLCILWHASVFAQTLPVGTPVIEDYWRRAQVKGEKDINVSFLIRPIYIQSELGFDSVYNVNDSFTKIIPKSSFSFAKGKVSGRLLPVRLKQQYNAHHPYGWNDAAMIPARGYQQQLSFGFFAKAGPLSIQLQPEIVNAQNKAFSGFPTNHTDSLWSHYYYIQNRIDNPEMFGRESYSKVFAGQSSIRLNVKKLSLGVSTENLWWGPGVRNALIMSNNAPGFKHITFNTTAPVLSPIGSFEWQLISGTLKNSGILPADTTKTLNGQRLYRPKNNNNRYLNGMIVTWQPKWTKGLHLGFSRVFYQYDHNIEKSLNGYLPVFGSFFKARTRDENAYGRDQLLSLFLRLVLPEAKAEVYAEYGRNDHSQDMRDFLLEPEHARAYIMGFKKLFTTASQKNVELFMEFTHMQNSETIRVRDQEGWYTHYQVRHGYTNLGQVLGAGIGPGGNSQSIGLKWVNGINSFGIMGERVVRNNDFYYAAFSPRRNFSSHWVDLSVSVNNVWQYKRFIFAPSIAWVKSLNYQWKQYTDVVNLHAQLSTSYVF